jgi:hypothetical protein
MDVREAGGLGAPATNKKALKKAASEKHSKGSQSEMV